MNKTMLQSFLLDASSHPSSCAPAPLGFIHSCPFCRCRSLDASINIKISPRNSSSNKHLPKNLIDGKHRNSMLNKPNQNLYHRTLQSPRKSGLSPHGNTKIIIQYISPEPPFSNTPAFRPFAKPTSNLNSKTSFIVSSPLKTSPRNIYTNENTPPKAKYLQKKSSRKNSLQNLQYTTPVQGLTLVDSQRVMKPFDFEQKRDLVQFVKPQQRIKAQQSDEISIKGTIDFYAKIPETVTKNIIKKASGQESSVSPFNSLADSSSRVRHQVSIPSTPVVTQFALTKKDIVPSIKKMVQSGDGSHDEIRGGKMEVEDMFQGNKIELIEKRSVELSPGRSSYSHEKFDKTLGKLKSAQRCVDNELIYSESDRQTLNNPTGSVQNLLNGPNNRNLFPQAFSCSQNSIRHISEQNGVSSQHKLDSLEMSENFSTPKEKYKAINEDKPKKSSGISFYRLGDNRKGIGSKMSGDSKRGQKVRVQDEISHERKDSAQSQMGLGQKKIKIKVEQEAVNQTENQIPRSAATQIPSSCPEIGHSLPPTSQPDTSKSCQQNPLFTAQLTQQLDLQYDYYFYRPIHNANLYQNLIEDFDGHPHYSTEISLESQSLDVTL